MWRRRPGIRGRADLRRAGIVIGGLLIWAAVRSWSVGDYFAVVGSIVVGAGMIGIGAGILAPWLGADLMMFRFRLRKGLLFRRDFDLGELLTMTSYEFEAFCREILQREGFDARLTPPSHDLGVDIELRRRSGRGLAQCKRLAPDHGVGRPVVQRLFGQMQAVQADFGWVLTTSYFTREASDWAEGKAITLVDGRQLRVLAAGLYGGRAREIPARRPLPQAAAVVTGVLLLVGAASGLGRLFGMP